MKKYPLLLLLLALLVPSAPDARAQTSEATSAEEAVRKLERAWLDAYEQHDAKAMEAIVADGFVITFPSGGKQSKQQIVDSMKRPPPSGDSVKFRTEKTEARVFGDDVVVLTGRVISENQRSWKIQHRRDALHRHLRAARWRLAGRRLPPQRRPQTQASSMRNSRPANQ